MLCSYKRSFPSVVVVVSFRCIYQAEQYRMETRQVGVDVAVVAAALKIHHSNQSIFMVLTDCGRPTSECSVCARKRVFLTFFLRLTCLLSSY